MELTVLERLVLQGLLPKEGNYTTLKLLRVCREALSFDDLENKRLGFHQDGDQVRWNENVNVVKNIEIGEVMKLEIVASLKKLEEEKKLRDEHFTLYEKFVEDAKNTVESVA